MKVHVIGYNQALDIDLSEEMDIASVKTLVMCELGADESIQLSCRGCTLIENESTLKDYALGNSETLYAGNPPADPERSKVLEMMRGLKSDPYQFSMLRQNNPHLAERISNDDADGFAKLMIVNTNHRRDQETERIRRATALRNDPFSIEAQRALEEEIQSENIENLRQEAMEHMPESFAQGSITMLYINVCVNGHDLKAFVDSGAQMTIMSQSCAEKCELSRLIDTRFQGMAVGVGQQKIIGRVHMLPLKVADGFLPTSLSILEKQPMDMILGLDMLKRHRCIIDLQENCLRIGTTNGIAKFLPESELPSSAKMELDADQNHNSTDASDSSGVSEESQIQQLISSTSHTRATVEEGIKTLMNLGSFSRLQCVGALVAANGSAEAAAAFLLGI